MNKILSIFALVALVVCTASADSISWHENENLAHEDSTQVLYSDDNSEVADLEPKYLVFTDFCIAARNTAQSYIKQFRDSSNRAVLNFLLARFTNIATKAMEARFESDAKRKELPISNKDKDVTLSEEESKDQLEKQVGDRIADDGTQTKSNIIHRLVSSVYGVIVSLAREVQGQFFEAIKAENIIKNADKILEACSDLELKLFSKIEDDFQLKKKMLHGDALKTGQTAIANLIDVTNMDKLNCITIRRMKSIKSVCETFQTSKDLLNFVNSESG